jgi:hypothetical protein
MHIGNYESEAALVEPGVRRERAIRKGSNNDWGAPGSTGLVRACEQEPERERESGVMREEELVPHLDPDKHFLVLPYLFVRSTIITA